MFSLVHDSPAYKTTSKWGLYLLEMCYTKDVEWPSGSLSPLEHFHPKASFGSQNEFEGKLFPMSFFNEWEVEDSFPMFGK